MPTEKTWLPTSSHWGAYRAVADADGGVHVKPHPADPAPSVLLGNIASSVRHPTRIARPSVRRGWLEGCPGPTEARGREEFVEVPWDVALDLVAEQLDSHLIAVHQVLDPVGEARDDYQILAGLAQRLDAHADFTEGRTPRQWLAHLYDEWRAHMSAQGHDLPAFAEFWSAGELLLPPSGTERRNRVVPWVVPSFS
jgi:anaerobic selenocysteine-containing dehydrogenase